MSVFFDIAFRVTRSAHRTSLAFSVPLQQTSLTRTMGARETRRKVHYFMAAYTYQFIGNSVFKLVFSHLSSSNYLMRLIVS